MYAQDNARFIADFAAAFQLLTTRCGNDAATGSVLRCKVQAVA